MFGLHKSRSNIYVEQKKLSENLVKGAKYDLDFYAGKPSLTDRMAWDNGIPDERIEEYTEEVKYYDFAMATYTDEMQKDKLSTTNLAIVDLDMIAGTFDDLFGGVHEYEYGSLNINREQNADKPNAKKIKQFQQRVDRGKSRIFSSCDFIRTMMESLVSLYAENNDIPLYDFSEMLRIATARLERAGFGDSDFCKWTRSIDTLWKDDSQPE